MSKIINNVKVEEYDGYIIPKPKKMTAQERKQAEEKIHELRNKVRKANNLPETKSKRINW